MPSPRMLASADVLVLDCQATGASPAHGSILEIGWRRTRGGDDGGFHSVLELPPGQRVPRQVAKLTGIDDRALRGAIPPRAAWCRLKSEAERIERGARPATPVVIHFARYEEPFLLELHRADDPSRPFPLELICTHEIARRLLPDLPRRSLRALTGYFGRAVGPLRRSGDHVDATLFVWSHLAALLEDSEGVATLDDLRRWLAGTAPPRRSRRAYPMPRETRLSLPERPGLYRMLRLGGDVLYVGKATSLKHRVNTYFRKQTGVHERTLEMLAQARALSITVTESALEAALLEADEIKAHRPPYNVQLMPDGRDVWFSSIDLASVRPSSAAGDRHPIGPLPSKDTLAALRALLTLLSSTKRGVELDADLRAGATWALPRHAPDLASFRAGLALFRAAHPLAEVKTPAALLALGAELRAKLARSASDDDDTDALHRPDVWDPDTVVHALETTVARAALAVRRASWLSRLSESALVFGEPAVFEGRRLLVFERGDLVRRAFVEPGARPPIPPGSARHPRERRRELTVARVDRLRVLSTELKRLTSERASADLVELRLGSGRRLEGARLARALEWV